MLQTASQSEKKREGIRSAWTRSGKNEIRVEMIVGPRMNPIEADRERNCNLVVDWRWDGDLSLHISLCVAPRDGLEKD